MRKLSAMILLLMAAVATAAPKKVFDVKSVVATRHGNTLTVVAKGEVRTGGWTNPKLVKTSGGTTTTFSFEAEPPTGIVTQMITPISATITTSPLRPPFPKLVKVVAETNSKTVTVKTK